MFILRKEEWKRLRGESLVWVPFFTISLCTASSLLPRIFCCQLQLPANIASSLWSLGIKGEKVTVRGGERVDVSALLLFNMILFFCYGVLHFDWNWYFELTTLWEHSSCCQFERRTEKKNRIILQVRIGTFIIIFSSLWGHEKWCGQTSLQLCQG